MIEIVRSIAAPAARDEVFEFLAEPRNHWELCGGSIELLEISEDADRPLNGVVRIRGPLGLSRLARTWVTSFEPPTELGGVAEIGSKTLAEVRWNLSEDGERQTRISLCARVLSIGMIDRLLLALGGRYWMRRIFAGTLRLLVEQVRPSEGRLTALDTARAR